MIAAFLTTPFDVIKTRMMTNTVKQYTITPLGWLSKIITEEGWSSLFKGWHVRIVYLTLGGAVYFVCYTLALNWCGANKIYQKTRE